MAISFADAQKIGTPASPPAGGAIPFDQAKSSPTRKSNVVSFDQATKLNEKPAVIPSKHDWDFGNIGDLLEQTEYGRSYKEAVAGSQATMQEGLAHMKHAQGPLAAVEGLSGLAISGFGALSYMFAPLTALIEEGAVKPTQRLTLEATDAAYSHIPMMDRPDFLRTMKGVSEMEEFGLQAAGGAVGAEHVVTPRATIVTRGFQAARDMQDSASPKVAEAGKKIFTGFDELAAKNEVEAKKVAEHVAGEDPALGKDLTNRITKMKVKLKSKTPAEIKEIGKKSVEEANIKGVDKSGGEGKIPEGWKQVGTTASGKPKLARMAPTIAEAGAKMRDVAKEVHDTLAPRPAVEGERDLQDMTKDKHDRAAERERIAYLRDREDNLFPDFTPEVIPKRAAEHEGVVTKRMQDDAEIQRRTAAERQMPIDRGALKPLPADDDWSKALKWEAKKPSPTVKATPQQLAAKTQLLDLYQGGYITKADLTYGAKLVVDGKHPTVQIDKGLAAKAANEKMQAEVAKKAALDTHLKKMEAFNKEKGISDEGPPSDLDDTWTEAELDSGVKSFPGGGKPNLPGHGIHKEWSPLLKDDSHKEYQTQLDDYFYSGYITKEDHLKKSKDLEDKAYEGSGVTNLPPEEAEVLTRAYKDLTKVGEKKGSNEGGIFEGKNGKKYYVKFYKNPLQGHTEALAAKLSELVGISTSEPKVATVNGQVGVLSRMQDFKDAHLQGDLEHLSKGQRIELAAMFYNAVLTKNWDVVGLDYSNIKINKYGSLIQMDTGGTFEFRAQGGEKPYGPDINELASLMNPDIPSGKVFNKLMQIEPGAFKAAFEEMKSYSFDAVKKTFKESNLPNWEKLHAAYLERRDALNDSGGDPHKEGPSKVTPNTWNAGDITHQTWEPKIIGKDPHPIEPALRDSLPAVRVFTPKGGVPIKTRVAISPKGEVLNSRNLPVHESTSGQMNFLKWFGESETLDYLGRPLVLYHATEATIPKWKIVKRGSISFSADRTFTSKVWSGDKVYPVYVRAKNLGDFRNADHMAKVKQWHKDHQTGYSTHEIEGGAWGPWERADMWKDLKWEGAILKESTGSPHLNVIIAKEGADVKSAHYNTGKYGETADASAAKEPAATASKDPVKESWGQLHVSVAHELWGKLEEAFHEGGSVSSNSLLDILTRVDGPHRDMLAHLREHVEDVRVKPVMGEIVDGDGVAWGDSPGLFHPEENRIYLRIDHQSAERTQTLVHEIVHKGTSEFVFNNPDHPLVKRLNDLHTETLKRVLKMREMAEAAGEIMSPAHTLVELPTPAEEGRFQGTHKGSGVFYGLTNTLEFMAEARSRPSFQALLVRSEKVRGMWVQLRSLVNEYAKKLGEMLGFKQKDAALLTHILDVTDKIIEESARARRKEGRLTAMAAEEAPTEEKAQRAFTIGKQSIEKLPGVSLVQGKLEGYTKEALRTINPEALGPEAKTAASTIAKAIAKQMQADSSHFTHSADRRAYWNKNLSKVTDFLAKAERGKELSDPTLEKARLAYKAWNEEIAAQDKGSGFEYELQDNYIAHIFEKGKEAADYLKQQFGKKFGDPGFIKDRTFDLYEEAIKAGFKPKFENPEDIMLARQHASDVAQMKVESLREMERFGVAEQVGDKAPEYPATKWRAPNGDWYWVHNNAHAVLHNAFDTQSLWTMEGIRGDVFRGTMALKNRMVPIKLALSLFHPLHVATIDNATSMVRASKELLSGTINPLTWTKRMAEGILYKDLLKETYDTFKPGKKRGGSRLLQVWQGKLRDGQLNAADHQALTYMFEGGFIPEMSAEYRSNSRKSLRDAMQKGQVAKTTWHAPWAAMEWAQAWMFEKWIPGLKVASYLKDVETALKTDPTLMDNAQARQLAFRKIAKSVDNRYGEMAYNTLFWNKTVKDLAVANTLSLGWQMGFIREYGGGALDIGQFAKGTGKLQQVKAGKLDRPMFVAFYSTQALLYGGLMTYALTGQPPQNLLDYLYPQTGGKDPSGKPNRATTMFYPREFFAIHKHMETKGVVGGLSATVQSKATGLMGLTIESLKGVSSFGDEIRDPTHPAYKQLVETLNYALGESRPITLSAIKKGGGSTKEKALAISGFGPAPKYVTDTKTEGLIKENYDKFIRPKETPYQKASLGRDTQEAKKAYLKGDAKYDGLMDKIKSTYDPQDLDGKMQAKLEKKWDKEDEKGEDTPPQATMFARLDWTVQKRLLDEMPPEDREKYLPYSNKKFLRDNYEPPAK